MSFRLLFQHTSSRGLAAVGVVFLLALPACFTPLTRNQQDTRQRYAQLDYPVDAEYGPDLDVVVRRDGNRITFVNRTARAYADPRIWVNQQFVRDLPRLDIGPDNDFELSRWTNQHREPFPVGSLLTPEDAEPVVLAELIDPDTGLRHRLLVWPDDPFTQR